MILVEKSERVNKIVSMPNNFKNDTAATIPILAKNPSATAANTKVETSLKIFKSHSSETSQTS